MYQIDMWSERDEEWLVWDDTLTLVQALDVYLNRVERDPSRQWRITYYVPD